MDDVFDHWDQSDASRHEEPAHSERSDAWHDDDDEPNEAEGEGRPTPGESERSEGERTRRRRRGRRGRSDRGERGASRPRGEAQSEREPQRARRRRHDEDDDDDAPEVGMVGGYEAEFLPLPDDDEPVAAFGADDDEGDGDEGGHAAAHRNVTSWKEAISAIVDSNLEARARSPHSSGDNSGRGGRGRRRGRPRGG